MGIVAKTLNALKRSPVYSMLTGLPYAPYRGSVLRFIDPGHISMLEAGCGRGNVARSRYFPSGIPTKLGIEIFEPYALTALSSGSYDAVLRGDVRSLPLKDKSVDCIVCVEVIEHMPKDQGIALIREFERVARCQIVISTTDIPLKPLDERMATDGNMAMYHQARWKPHEFQDLGFDVYGMYPRFTEGSSIDPIYFLSYLLPLMWLVKHFPKRAKAFIGIKRFPSTIPADGFVPHGLR
jgi:SAM-dependent methyltransferase